MTVTKTARIFHPVNFFYKYTDTFYPVNEIDRKIDENCRRIRALMMDYLQKRKRGENKSQLEGQVDLLNLFLESDVFDDEDIIDEMVDFFFAATNTTEKSSQTMLSHYIKDPDSL